MGITMMTRRRRATPSICIEFYSLLVVKCRRVVKPIIPACTCPRNRRFLSAEISMHINKTNISVVTAEHILDQTHKAYRSSLE